MMTVKIRTKCALVRRRSTMKHVTHKMVMISLLLLFALIIPVGCIPVKTREPNDQLTILSSTFTETALTLTFTSTASQTASETDQPTQTFTPTASETARPSSTFTPIPVRTTAKPTRPTRTFTPTASPTFTETFQPTQMFTPTVSETDQPTPTFTPTASQTEQPTSTFTPTASETKQPTPTFTRCPPGTAEPFWVQPVTSPTDQLTQVIAVYIGRGEEVSVITESGTFTVTGSFGNPALVEITLLPNTEHHLQVFAKVGIMPGGTGCTYGGYTLSTTRDKQGNPLTIIQVAPTP
jgi:hypothetical protein